MGSFEATTYAAEHLFGFERHPEADLLTGWSLDEQVAFELEGEVLLERRVAAILSCGAQDAAPMCRDLMARCSPAELHARVGFASPRERGARPKAALASAIVWHALSPEYDAAQARAWIEVFMPYMPPVDEVAFTEEITLSADEVFERVAGIAGPDALATAWTRRVDEVWDASLEARLPGLFAHHTLGPRATVDLVDAANRHEVAAAWEPARDALFRARLAALESGDDARWEETREELLAWRDRAEAGGARSNW